MTKKQSLLVIVVYLIVSLASTVNGQCSTTGDIINAPDQLDSVVLDYSSLDSALNKCRADTIIGNGLINLNSFQDAKSDKRVVDFLTRQLKTKTKWRTDNIHTTKTQERTRIKTQYVDNWLTHTIIESRDVTHTHIIKEPITFVETVHNFQYGYHRKETLTHTIYVEKIRTKTERREKVHRDMIRTVTTKCLTKTIIRDDLNNDDRNAKNNYDSDSDDQEVAIERRIDRAI